MDSEEYRERIRAIAKIKKLRALAEGNANPHEAEAARKRADALAQKHGLDMQPLADQAQQMKRRFQESANTIEGLARAFQAFGSNIKQTFPGIDDEDYSKYAKKPRGEEG